MILKVDPTTPPLDSLALRSQQLVAEWDDKGNAKTIRDVIREELTRFFELKKEGE